MEENKFPTDVRAVSTENEENIITLTDLFHQAKAHWRWYVISVAACLALAVLYLLHATPMYTRSTEILLKDDSSQSVSSDLSQFGISSTPPDILNEMFIMTSPEIMERVVDRLDLNDVYLVRKGLRTRELYHNSPVDVRNAADSIAVPDRAYGFRMELNDDKTGAILSRFTLKGKKVDGEVTATFGAPVETPVGTFLLTPTKFMHPEANDAGEVPEVPSSITYSHIPVKTAARDYSQQLQSKYDEDRGNVITLSIVATSTMKADDILRAVVDAYNLRWIADKNQIAQATSLFIDERLGSIESELGDVETNITDYKSTHRMMDMDAMASLYLSQSSENQHALNALAQDIAIGRYIKKELAAHDITRLLPATAEIGGTNIQQMVTDYNRMVAERNLKLESLPEQSPIISQKTAAIESAREAILASVDAALESLNSRYKAIRLIDDQTQNQLATAPGQAKYLMSEERKQKVKESLYVFLLQRREENELNQAFTVNNTRMVTEPYGPDAPTAPNTKMVLLIAFVMGFVIPTLIIYLREVTNTKVRSRRDIESLPLPFLGEIPLADVPQPNRVNLPGRKKAPLIKRQVLVHADGVDVVNEAFRMIRTNIDFIGSMSRNRNAKNDGEGKVISVVSLNAGSGKTFVSLNVAASFALKGRRTCLVDFDLRKGTVSHSVNSPRHGITDLLIGRTENIDSLIVKNVDGIEGFDLLPEGIIPPNPTELLYSDRLPAIINHLKQEYDYIVLDCPPVEIVADARLLNPYVDLTIFVMRSGLFDRMDLATLRQLYESHRYNNLALVLNATDKVHGVYGAYGYGYRDSNRKRRHK